MIELEMECEDPKRGLVNYRVSPFIMTPVDLNLFWKKASKFPTLFNHDVRKDYRKFLELMLNQESTGKIIPRGLFWRIDTDYDPLVGVFYMTNLELGVNALVHFSFLDGRIRGRHPLARAMIKKAFEELPLARLSAELPAYVADASMNFVKRIGFRKEGIKLRAAELNGELFHVHMFGILREDVLNGSSNSEEALAEVPIG